MPIVGCDQCGRRYALKAATAAVVATLVVVVVVSGGERSATSAEDESKGIGPSDRRESRDGEEDIAIVAGANSRIVAAAPSTAVLFCTPKGVGNRPYLDLNWLCELHQAGFEPDYLEHHSEFSWERIRRYNCLVIYGAPAAEEGEETFQFNKGPRRKEYVQLIERFLAAGGGVFAMIHTDNADKHVRELIEPWGARLPLEFYVETDRAKIAPLPRMGGNASLSLVDEVLPSPVTTGVRRLWLPYGAHYNASWSGPISVSNDWQVVVKGSKTSHTTPVDLSKSSFAAPPDAMVRPGGVEQPDLFAIRSYKQGRILLCCQRPVFSIGQGTKWLFDRRCLSTGVKETPSDFERLIHNTLVWLSKPSLQTGSVGGYRAAPSRFDPPNYDPNVRKEFEARSWSAAELDRHRPPRDGKIFRGLIGARSAFTTGQGTVSEYASAAEQAGLNFVIFSEQFDKLTPEMLHRLGDECLRHSNDKVLLVPGYAIDTNVGNHMFFSGYDLPWPRPECLTGPNNTLLNQQYQDENGEYVKRSSLLEWILRDHERENGHMVGYYNFDDPCAMKMTDLKACSAAAVLSYRDGKLIDDRRDDYLVSVEGTLPTLPVAYSVVRSPDELIAEACSGHALTYAQAQSLDTLLTDALRWNSQYDGLNVFASTGPIIHAWPEHFRSVIYGAEPFVVDKELMPSVLHVSSDVGLKEVRIMNGRRLLRRFLPNGSKDYRQTLHLSGAIQQNLVLIAEDVRGGRAMSFPRRCWKPGSFYISFCSDHVNDCGRQYLARGIGIFQTHRYPLFPGGQTWDGGPRGVRPVVHLNQNSPFLESNLGEEGGTAFNNLPILEFADDQAIVCRSVLSEVYDPKVPAVNSWYTFGPMNRSRLLESTRVYSEFNRPLVGPAKTGWAAMGVRSGAVVSNFANTIEFKQDQVVNKLRLMRSNWLPGQPGIFVVGHGESHQEYDLLKRKKTVEEKIATGGWFGFYSRQTYNGVLFINRGDPIVVGVNVDPRGKGAWYVRVMADLEGKPVKAGDQFHHELLSVNEALDTEARGPARFRSILKYLASPVGMTVLGGSRINTLGFFDVQVDDVERPVELKVAQPTEPLALTIPVRVLGLNPRWSAGLFQITGHSTGFYTAGKNVYTTVGFDFAGRVYASLYPDQSAETQVLIGHPVVCDKPELFLEVMPRSSKESQGYDWHIAVNNPTDRPVSAAFRGGMKLPGLLFEPQTHTIPAGGHLVLRN